MRRPKRIFFLVTLMGIALLAAGALALRQALDPFNKNAFSVSAWATATPESRATMARDALHFVPAGITESQVIALLGKPDHVLLPSSDAGSSHVLGARAYTYELGNWSMHGMDAAFLYVHLDGSGRVIKSDIYGY